MRATQRGGNSGETVALQRLKLERKNKTFEDWDGEFPGVVETRL